MAPPEPALVAEVTALLDAAAAAREQTRRLVAEQALARISAMTDPAAWWSAARTTALVRALARASRAGQRQTAATTAAYAARVMTLMLGRTVRPQQVVDASRARGVPLEDVYGRLADYYRVLTATRGPDSPHLEGRKPLNRQQILDRVLARAELYVHTDQRLAFRDQWASAMEASPSRIVGYRRVIHPELAVKTGTCGLCVVASDHHYTRGDLLPVHERCGCDVAPVVGKWHGPGDPGSSINAADLAGLYKAAGGSTSGQDLKRVRVQVVTDPELGPQLQLASGPGVQPAAS